MVELLVAAIGLGIAGIDPVGALLAVNSLAAGARDRTVVAYVATMVLTTALLGTILSLTVGTRLADIDWSFLDSGPQFWATGEILAGLGVLAWVARRLRSGGRPGPTKKSDGKGGYALLGVGVLFGLSAVLDPTFVSLVVLAGRDGAIVETVLAHLLWIVLSQAPAVVIAVAILTGRHRGIVERFQAWWQRIAPALSRLATVCAALAGVVLILDGLWWVATDRFLITF